MLNVRVWTTNRRKNDVRDQFHVNAYCNDVVKINLIKKKIKFRELTTF